MKILLTGATGFIGSNLVRRLTNKGHQLVFLTRNTAKAEDKLRISSGSFRWDAAREVPPPEALEGLDAVINLAGETVDRRWNEEGKRRIKESRILGTRFLMRGIQDFTGRKPRVIISASAVGYYGDRGNEILTESSRPGSGFLADTCRDWETELFQPAIPEIRRVALRTGVVLGRGGGALLKMFKPYRYGLGGPLGSGEQWVSWIHLDDHLSIIEHCLSNPDMQGSINSVSPAPLQQKEFAKTLARALGKPAFFCTPEFALKLALGEMADLLLSSQRVVPDKLNRWGFPFRFPELSAALTDLIR